MSYIVAILIGLLGSSSLFERKRGRIEGTFKAQCFFIEKFLSRVLF